MKARMLRLQNKCKKFLQSGSCNEPNLKNIRLFLSPRRGSAHFKSDPIAEWHRNHPRYKFLRRQHGKVLDIGCGDGGLGNYLNWPETLNDLEMYGCDLDSKSKVPSGYTQYLGGGYQEISSLKSFTGITAIHLIEHLPNLQDFFDFLSTATEGTELYLEWPDLASCIFPTTETIQKNISRGDLIMTSNYFDDDTHLPPRPPTPKEVQELLENSGFEVIDSFRFQRKSNEAFVWEMIHSGDRGGVTLAYWENFGFARCLNAVRRCS